MNVPPCRDHFFCSKSITTQVLAIIIPAFALAGVVMNVIVLWNLFAKSNALNLPTRQLHGHLMVSNFLLLVVCVPAISYVWVSVLPYLFYDLYLYFIIKFQRLCCK